MLSRFSRKKESALDEPIAKLRESLLTYSPEDPEYQAAYGKFLELTKLRNEENRSWKVKPDTLAVIAGNLLGILIIVNYERVHVLSSKGMGLVRPNSV